MKNSLADGIYDGLSFIEYHNDTAVGSSTLKTIIQKTPAHVAMRSTINSEIANMGTAVHCAILEPEKFQDTIIRGPVDRRGNRWKEACAEAEINGQLVLIEEEFDNVARIRDAVFAYKTARELLENKLVAERSLFWTDKETGVRCKARPDLNTKDHLIVDVKTTVSAHPESFMRDVLKYGYHIQEAHYVDGAYATHENFDIQGFVFLCIEKVEPFACAVYRLDAATVREGLNLRNKALKTYQQCSEFGVWPSYPEGIQELRIPRFGFQTLDINEFDIPA
jgi:exodeoxyribonuclease VIII